jgi:aryl-alcohol dehydrogenase-like predicted oxidoreductase
MQHRPLGSTGIEVSAIGYGTNMLGRQPSADRPGDEERTTEDYYVGMVHAALDAGVTLFDTANSYQDGRSEELLGKALEGRRAEAVIATKCGSRSRDFSPEAIVREAQESLERLRTDCLDVLQLHNPSFEDIRSLDWVRGLEALRQSGRIRSGGISVGNPDQGVWLVERDLVDVIQVNFNIFRPEAREHLLPLALDRGVGVLVKIPMARGLLTGKYGSASIFPEGDWHRQGFVGEPGEMLAAIDRLDDLARSEDMELQELALRWVLSEEGVSAAIPGAKSIEHVRSNAAVGDKGALPGGMWGTVEAAVGRPESG